MDVFRKTGGHGGPPLQLNLRKTHGANAQSLYSSSCLSTNCDRDPSVIKTSPAAQHLFTDLKSLSEDFGPDLRAVVAVGEYD